MSEPRPFKQLDFNNTAVAFAQKSNHELKKMAWLFKMMNNQTLVNLGAQLGLFAIKFRLPFTETLVRNTIFPQFCGGENILDCQKSIDKLYENDTLTILDYGAEGKSNDDDFDEVMKEVLRAIDMAASNNSVPVVVSKISGLIDTTILAKLNNKETLSKREEKKYQRLVERVDTICNNAQSHNISLYFDAEESWIQDPIDELALKMMEKYNQNSVVVYNTYQLYRNDKLDHLYRDHKRCLRLGVMLGAKLVRGAYMDKERQRATELGYPSPIQVDKAATDRDYNAAIRYCLDNYLTIASCCASHNMESNLLQAQLLHDKGLDIKHPHINFCQLYGMSDNITFNLADAGYNACKYVVYGPIKDVIPYLIRRTQENASVTGEMSRELKLVSQEIKRRRI
jgi:proline dehydrogenase